MKIDPNIFMTVIAIDYPSGIFGSTVKATNRFGPKRVFDSPAMENALTGIAIGAALLGKRPIVVHPRNDFMFLAFDKMINVAAKWRYMFGGNAGRTPAEELASQGVDAEVIDLRFIRPLDEETILKSIKKRSIFSWPIQVRNFVGS